MIEDKIQEAIKPIISMYSQIELELIEKIAEHFKLNEEFINSDYWYLEKLKEMGGLNNETIKLLEEYTGRTKQELLKAMKDIGINAIPIEQLNIATQKGALLNPETIINSVNIQNIIKYSYDEIEKTFLQLNETISEQVKKTYTDVITQTYIKTQSGIYSYGQAILESLDELGDKGISILTYQDKNGLNRNYDVVGTVRRDLLVATRGLAGKINEEVIKESGHHIIRVTNHFGARTGDGNQDYTNHAWWQEKQFFCWNYDGKATEEEKKLPDFMEHCNYGDVQGIVGINCKHLFTVWYGSLEKQKLDFTYEENQEQYEKTQQQRYLETGVRKWKRKQVIANKAQDEEGYKKASLKAKEWQDRLSTFTNENELKREYTREHIKGYKPVKIKEQQYIDITKEMINNSKNTIGEIKEQNFLEKDGIIYKVKGSDVIFNPDEDERKCAKILTKTFGDDVILLPKVNNPQNVKSADYIFKNDFLDLKTINKSNKKELSKDAIYNSLKNCQKQSNNFILDITNYIYEKDIVYEQINKIYNSKHRSWVNKIYLLEKEKIIKVFERKK